MRLTPGTRLGPYEVLSTLGTGGMAEVYRARDTRLGQGHRPQGRQRGPGRQQRAGPAFRAGSASGWVAQPSQSRRRLRRRLHDGVPYFITELLKGESLRQRLSRGRIPVDSALDWGGQLAHGLAAAHARGVVHRDVKPENVFVTSDGQVKLLDFGIAKLAEGEPARKRNARHPG